MLRGFLDHIVAVVTDRVRYILDDQKEPSGAGAGSNALQYLGNVDYDEDAPPRRRWSLKVEQEGFEAALSGVSTARSLTALTLIADGVSLSVRRVEPSGSLVAFRPGYG
jgi:hypothetical protein